MKRTVTLIMVVFIMLNLFSGCATSEKIKIKALILPKFEVGEMTGDAPGEAQFYYDAYCAEGQEYSIAGGCGNSKLYVRDGVALYVTGMGKVNSALSTAAILADSRFDFSEAYVISTGCAGAAYKYGVMGDVYVITAAVDFDLGHHVDVRDMEEQTDSTSTWYRDGIYDDSSHKVLNPELSQRVYDMVKDVKVATTEKTKRVMASAFNDEEWATRDPRVLKGTSVTSDDYWKGIHQHNTAEYIVKSYGCPDPFAASEMEDLGIALALERANMLDRYIILRGAVNMDVFMNGDTPDSLWNPDYIKDLSAEGNKETADIFDVAMENNYLVGRVIIDAILRGDM